MINQKEKTGEIKYTLCSNKIGVQKNQKQGERWTDQTIP